MQQTTYASRLRYLDADDLDNSDVDFEGLDVRGVDDEKLGEVDGFLVDSGTGRVLYTVVDSGGWFTSRRFLLPIGHATVDRDASALRVDVARNRLRSYPEFDERQFSQLSDEDLRSYEHRMGAVCCPEETTGEMAGWRHDSARHYQQPAWWSATMFTASRLQPIAPSSFRTRASATESSSAAGDASGASMPVREIFDREHVAARASEDREGRAADDVSPHVGGRAQPGDVLGIESGGETTGIGDTAEAEDKRRRDAERARRSD